MCCSDVDKPIQTASGLSKNPICFFLQDSNVDFGTSYCLRHETSRKQKKNNTAGYGRAFHDNSGKRSVWRSSATRSATFNVQLGSMT